MKIRFIRLLPPCLWLIGALSLSGQSYHSIGEPTDHEQYFLELINRARANPKEEGVRLAASTDPDVVSACEYFGVDLAVMQSEFEALAVRPPLAMNARLLASARKHTADMLANVFQGHTGSNGSTLGSRATAEGYAYSKMGENVYSYAERVWHAHAGFQIDWGFGGTAGMQTGRGHRMNIHGDYREVGIGAIQGQKTLGDASVGPMLVTQDFATAQSTTAFVTGVAYYDLDGDGFYSPGEGIGGVEVSVSGVSTRALTTASGGYAIPVPTTAANRVATFSGTGLSATAAANIVSQKNVKVDFRPLYLAPRVSGPQVAKVGRAESYQFDTVGGASAHEWKVMRKAAVADDGAEDLSRVLAEVSSDYSALSTTVKHAGAASYHLAHPGSSASQTLTYPEEISVATGASLSFRSRLGLATSVQSARVGISVNGGTTWQNVWSQAGNNGWGETTFRAQTVSLAAYAGQSILLRFEYLAEGSYFPLTSDGVGWYIDTISFTGMDAAADARIGITGAGAFAFTPESEGVHFLAVRPIVSGRALPFGPLSEVVVADAPNQDYAGWMEQTADQFGLDAASLGTPQCDANRDGVCNLLAYAMGAATAMDRPPHAPSAVSTEDRLALRYSKSADRPGFVMVPECTEDLVHWHAVGAPGAPAGFTDTLADTIDGVEIREASVPKSDSTTLFLRLRASIP